MAASLRPGAYIWATWLAPLLAGTSSCAWAVWFRAHYYHRKASTFDDPTWQAEHDAMVTAAAEDLRADEFKVSVEDDNRFLLKSHGISLAGRPDLIAIRRNRVVIVDCKSGTRRLAHRFQLLTYMVVLPCVRTELKGMSIEGLILYPDETVSVPCESVDEEFRQEFRRVVHLVGGPTPPLRVPSAAECHFCPVGDQDCPERIDLPEVAAVANHGLF